ncbi:MAG TPA: YozE family protein [Polyangiaceae bacterium]|nr:YozE family protein [Polyangiaceae bacterium]
MSKFTTFYEWLEKQKGQKSPLGSLASDATRDEAFPKDVASLDALLAYMKTKNFSGLKIATARIAWKSYSRGQGPDRPI